MIETSVLERYPKRATLREAAKLLGFSEYSINQMCKQGILPYITVGRRRFVLMDLAEAAIEAEARATQQKRREELEEATKPKVQEIHLGKHYQEIKKLV